MSCCAMWCSLQLQQKAIAKIDTIKNTDVSPTSLGLVLSYSPPILPIWQDRVHGFQNRTIKFSIPDNKSALTTTAVDQTCSAIWRMYIWWLYVHIFVYKSIFSILQVSTNTGLFQSCAKNNGNILYVSFWDYSVEWCGMGMHPDPIRCVLFSSFTEI